VWVSQISGGAQKITAGAHHTCAVVNGGVKCWGENDNGQLGNGNRINSDEPVDVESLNQGVVNIASKGNHTCAQTQDGLFCWGYNASGQLGGSSRRFELRPRQVSVVNGVIEQFSVGDQHTCVVRNQGTQVFCWGYRHLGQLSSGGKSFEKLPFKVALSHPVTALGAGVNHTCALMGDLFSCWGQNGNGQLGDRSLKSRSLPNIDSKLDGEG
jgi:hypothetical protein